MSVPKHLDKVEAFLFDLNVLAMQHKATIRALGYGEFHVEVNGQKVFVNLNPHGDYLQIDNGPPDFSCDDPQFRV